MSRAFSDPADRDQLRCFAEFFDGLAIARELELRRRAAEETRH